MIRKGFPTNWSKAGVSLIEIILVVVIIALVALLFLFIATSQLEKSRDGKRKADLNAIKIAFEEYYNDNGCYPDSEVLQDCGGAELSPYLAEIPCDPSDETPYLYLPLEADTCKGYRILTSLENASDPSIADVGCTSSCGCGWGDAYNFGVAVGAPVSDGSCQVQPPSDGGQPSPSGGSGGQDGGSSSPSPSPTSGSVFACDTTTVCQEWEAGHPDLAGCYTFTNPDVCEVLCNQPDSPYACEGI